MLKRKNERGLNYAVPPQFAPIADIVNNIESAIQFDDFPSKSALRHEIERCILESAGNQNFLKQSDANIANVIRQLKARDVVYSRADKGIAVVIMDKMDYESKVLEMINSGPYEECKYKNGKPKDPLNSLIEEANSAR
nr:uncharacterized protein LOC115265204 [Aedes albopictus]